MHALRPATKLYIAALAVGALAFIVCTLPSTGALTVQRVALAGFFSLLTVIAFRFPISFAVHTHLSLATSAIFATVLLFEPGVAMIIAGVGSLVAAALRRQFNEPSEMLFNSSQVALQTGMSGLVLGATGWDILALPFDEPLFLLMIPVAAVAGYVTNTLLVAMIVGLQSHESPLPLWYTSSINIDRTEFFSLLSQYGLGVLAAVLVDAHVWALFLLLLPAIAVYCSLDRHVKLRQRVEKALDRAQQIAHLGSWDWDLRTGEKLWSDEVFRIFGFGPQSFVPTYDRFLESVHSGDREEVRLAIHGALYEGKPYTVEHRILARDGAQRIVHQQGEVCFEGGAPVRMVATIQDVTERKELEQALAHRAFHDALTDLPNRALFTHRLESSLVRATQYGETVGVLFLDLDGFKYINDSFGHKVGDQLLIAVAGRLRSSVRPVDLVARLGGDEFTILLQSLSDREEAKSIAGRIIDALSEPFILEDREVFVSSSIGIALNEPGPCVPDELLRNADAAMYEAKNTGKAHYEVFDGGMKGVAIQRVNMESDLRRALERNELKLHYQPKVDLVSGKVMGVEALLRWQHPQRGLVPPMEFIRLAEETGLILPMGRWVLQEACQHAKRWQDAYSTDSPVVSVNLSVRQFQSPELVEEIAQILRETGLEPGGIKLEITEGVVMEDVASTMLTLRKLKQLGIQLAIDDFGTGYSSLSYLKRFPVDMLKIDRSFVHGLGQVPEDTAIVQSVINLAHALGLTVVAEGVETEKQAARLRLLGCELGQGYHFARPMPGAEVDKLIGENLRPERSRISLVG